MEGSLYVGHSGTICKGYELRRDSYMQICMQEKYMSGLMLCKQESEQNRMS